MSISSVFICECSVTHHGRSILSTFKWIVMHWATSTIPAACMSFQMCHQGAWLGISISYLSVSCEISGPLLTLYMNFCNLKTLEFRSNTVKQVMGNPHSLTLVDYQSIEAIVIVVPHVNTMWNMSFCKKSRRIKQ